MMSACLPFFTISLILLLLIAQLRFGHCSSGHYCIDTSWSSPSQIDQQACDLEVDNDVDWPKADCRDSSVYYTCSSRKRILLRFQCRTRSVFDQRTRRCESVSTGNNSKGGTRYRRQSEFDDCSHCHLHAAGSQLVGQSCSFNTDCQGSGMYCESGFCTCTNSHVAKGDYCYEKKSPEESGCEEDIQCSAVWDGAFCDKGKCSCPTDAANLAQYYPVKTRDGTVCVTGTATGTLNTCPLPAGIEFNVPPSPAVSQGVVSILHSDGEATEVTCLSDERSGTYTAACNDGIRDKPEMYDCIRQRVPDPGAAATAPNGVCCPNRALTCMMPMNAGDTTAAAAVNFQRYWYNSVLDDCVQFNYHGGTAGGTTGMVRPYGNANNFGSKEMCLSYCRNRCPRGQPLYSNSGAISSSFSPNSSPLTCSASQSVSTCGTSTNHACTTVGQNQYCCPTKAFICGTAGGLTAAPTLSPDFGVCGNGGVCGKEIIRYYFDPTSRRCSTFNWKQSSGNFNNFASLEQCESYCLDAICERGKPLGIPGTSPVTNQPCTSNIECPTTHECVKSVCCPKKQHICSQDKAEGTTSSVTNFGEAWLGIVTRDYWWYNSVTSLCERFTYGGTNGNDNRFDTFDECAQYCSDVRPEPKCPQGSAYKDSDNIYKTCREEGVQSDCPSNYECYFDGVNYGCCATQAFVCSLLPASGRECGSFSTRFYFDIGSKTCLTFTYNGCDGNQNNFPTLAICESYCQAGGCPNGGAPQKLANKLDRICSDQTPCGPGFECSSVQRGVSSTINLCCPSRATICQSGNQNKDGSGKCGSNAGITRYYFDVALKACKRFKYSGCQSNGNNFPTLRACQNFCFSAACDSGDAAYVTPGSPKPIGCDTGRSNSCPDGYTCRFDSVFETNICCGSSSFGACQVGERVYIAATTLEPQECEPSDENSCYSGYLCRLSTVLNKYFCCAPASNAYCASGYVAALNLMTSKPIPCNLVRGGNECTTGFTCQTTVIGSVRGFCCSEQALCPNELEVYRDPKGGQYRTCLPGTPSARNACPPGYTCLATPGATAFGGYCCGTGGIVVCGSGSPQLTDGIPTSCNPGIQGSCNAGFSCTLYQPTDEYYCCQGVNNECGMGTALRVGSLLQLCTMGGAACPSGYECQQSPINPDYYYCCNVGPTPCPPDKSPYILNGIIRKCRVTGPPNCPTGYQCLSSATNSYCCSTAVSRPVCGAGYEVYSPEGYPVACNPTTNRCPASYDCRQYRNSGSFYCCTAAKSSSSSAASICPLGSPYVINDSAQICSPLQNSCPPTHNQCLYNQERNQYFCCTSASILASPCPNGGAVRAKTCSPQRVNSCEAEESCVLISESGRFQCCSNVNGASCPNGGQITGVPCSPTPNSCLPGQECLEIVATNRFECCTSRASSSRNSTSSKGASSGKRLISLPLTPAFCPAGGSLTTIPCPGPTEASVCGLGSSCQLVAAVNAFRCCVSELPPTKLTNTPSTPPPPFLPPTTTTRTVVRTVIGVPIACPQGGTVTNVPCDGPGSTVCGQGGLCQLIEAITLYRCCTVIRSVAVRQTCPNGGELTATACRSIVDVRCGAYGSCQYILVMKSFRCCLSRNRPRPISSIFATPKPPTMPSLPSSTLNGCPRGGTPLRGRFCSPILINTCPIGSTCQFIASDDRFTCCQQPVCPMGGTATTQICRSRSDCLRGQTCEMIATSGRFQCCSGILSVLSIVARRNFTGPKVHPVRLPRLPILPFPKPTTSPPPPTPEPICPGGGQLYRNLADNRRPLLCTTAQANNCPFGYSCRPAVNGPRSSYCCADIPDKYCAPLGKTLIYEGTTIPVICTPGGLPCPRGYSCRMQFCCSVTFTGGKVFTFGGYNEGGDGGRGGDVSKMAQFDVGCPDNRLGYVPSDSRIEKNTDALTCNKEIPNCPLGFECVDHIDRTRDICCAIRMSEDYSNNDRPFLIHQYLNTKEIEENNKKLEIAMAWETIRVECNSPFCQPGQYGCKSSQNCAGVSICVDSRCVCPGHMLISSRNKCVSSCADGYYNREGVCMPVNDFYYKKFTHDAAYFPGLVQTDGGANNVSGIIQPPCSLEQSCSDSKSYCDPKAGRCECFPGYYYRFSLPNTPSKCVPFRP